MGELSLGPLKGGRLIGLISHSFLQLFRNFDHWPLNGGLTGSTQSLWLVYHFFVFDHEQTHGSKESSLVVLYNVQKNVKLASYSLTVRGFVLSLAGKVFKNFK